MNLEKLRESFAANFAERGELGASLSVWKDGTEVLQIADGFCDRERSKPWTTDTPVLVWSATKGPAAACALHCLQEKNISLERSVAELWPEFGQSGKERITFADLLSHRAGLAAMNEKVSVFDYAAIIDALARQRPEWNAHEGSGYHARTFGFLLDEIVRRLSGMTLRDYWRDVFAEPMRLDFWMGAPTEVLPKIAPVFPARAVKDDGAFSRALADPASLSSRTFASPSGLRSVASMNTHEARTSSLPAFGGIGTAHALGKFYAMLANGGTFGGVKFFQNIDGMTAAQFSGIDRVLQREIAFSAGFMKDPIDESGKKLRKIFGPSQTAFGHPGAGGSLAFADPEHGISFAYVMNQMDAGVLPGEKTSALVEALYRDND